MSATADPELVELRRANAELQSAYAELQKEHNAALAELQSHTAALAQRTGEYGERIEQQAATVDVIKTMSASPGDAQPVFRLIVERALAFCEADGASLALLMAICCTYRLALNFFIETTRPTFPVWSIPQQCSVGLFARATSCRCQM